MSKEEWMLTRRGKKSRLPTKRELKRARRAENAKVSKLEALKRAKEEKEKETAASTRKYY